MRGHSLAQLTQEATAAVRAGRQDLLIPKAGNELLRSRAGTHFRLFKRLRINLPMSFREESCVLYSCVRWLKQTCVFG